MSEKNKQRMEKFVALCDSGKPWYVFLVLFSLLLAANALLELLTEQRVKSWVWLLNVAGIVGGTTIRIIADGADEQAAVDGLIKLVESGFAE